MEPRRVAVFFYGLFMDADLLRTKGVDPLNPRRASVANHALRIGQRATLVPHEGSETHGFVMDLTHAEIDTLYAEPTVSMYRPEAMVCETSDGTSIPALVFVLPNPPAADEKNTAYAEKLRALAQRLNLPAEYVESIQ